MKKNISIAIITGVVASLTASLLARKFMQKKLLINDPKPAVEKTTATAISEPALPAQDAPDINPLIQKIQIKINQDQDPAKAQNKEIHTGPVAPNGQPLYDFKDEKNLIFCDETQLGKRLIQLEKSINIRDIGGYTGHDGRKIKWRKVIRSEELAHLSDKDVSYFSALKLKHVFDFRNQFKSERQVDRLPKNTEYHLLPIFSSADMGVDHMDFTQPGAVDQFMRNIYKIQTEERAQCFAEVLKYLTEPSEFPILYHCTNGKDRTGFMTYLILSLLGVKEDVILSDYSLTNLTFDESYLLLGNIMSEELGIENYHLWEFYGVKPEWLQLSMDYVNKNFGNVETYLMEETDLREKDFKKIRENLLAK